MRFHEGVADCGDAAEDVFSGRGGWAGEGLDEVDQGIWALGALVYALPAEWHCGGCMRCVRMWFWWASRSRSCRCGVLAKNERWAILLSCVCAGHSEVAIGLKRRKVGVASRRAPVRT